MFLGIPLPCPFNGFPIDIPIMVFNHHRLRGNGCLAPRGEDEGFLTIPLPGVNSLREWNSI